MTSVLPKRKGLNMTWRDIRKVSAVQKERLWKHTQSSGKVQVKVAEKEDIPLLRRRVNSYFLLFYIFILFSSILPSGHCCPHWGCIWAHTCTHIHQPQSLPHTPILSWNTLQEQQRATSPSLNPVKVPTEMRHDRKMYWQSISMIYP